MHVYFDQADIFLIETLFFESQEKSQALIAGRVLVKLDEDDFRAFSPSPSSKHI